MTTKFKSHYIRVIIAFFISAAMIISLMSYVDFVNQVSDSLKQIIWFSSAMLYVLGIWYNKHVMDIWTVITAIWLGPVVLLMLIFTLPLIYRYYPIKHIEEE